MTDREIKISHAILKALHDMDGGQAGEITLHGEATQICPCSVAEFTAALALCDTQGWVTGVKSRFKGKLWSINDAGEGALLQM